MKICLVRQLLSVVVLICCVTGCSEEGLVLRDAWISEAPPNAAAQAGYLTIENNSSQSVALVSADSAAFKSIEFHRTVYDKSTSMAKMVHQKQVEIGPRAKLRFEPGSYHLMLIKPKKALIDGDTVPMTLVFADGSRIEIEFAVRREAFHL